MFSDGRTTLIGDSGGTVIGCVAPLTSDLNKIQKIGEMLRDLQKHSRKVAVPPRGMFKIISHGIQMGGGSKVRSSFSFYKFTDKIFRSQLHAGNSKWKKWLPKVFLNETK
jgi:hypothetical protein